MSTVARRPRIIPVIDVMGGVVVRAVGGRRDEYRPVDSVLTRSTNPRDVANALIAATGTSDLYVADLDAIVHRTRPNLSLIGLTDEFAIDVWLDCGIRVMGDPLALPKHTRLRPIIGTETACGIPALRVTEIRFGHGRPVVSIDLSDGRLLGSETGWRPWGATGPWSINDVIEVARLFTRTVIVLDLARVGTRSGVAVEECYREFRDRYPDIELIVGGGVRDWGDVDRLGEIGVDGVLVASAFHDGSLTFPRPAP